jgi:hypothetical protein
MLQRCEHSYSCVHSACSGPLSLLLDSVTQEHVQLHYGVCYCNVCAAVSATSTAHLAALKSFQQISRVDDLATSAVYYAHPLLALSKVCLHSSMITVV